MTGGTVKPVKAGSDVTRDPRPATHPRHLTACGPGAGMNNVIPLDTARMARATRDRPLIEWFAAMSAGDAARWELSRQRKIERMQRVVAWYAAAAIGLAFWVFVLRWAPWAIIFKLVGVL